MRSNSASDSAASSPGSSRSQVTWPHTSHRRRGSAPGKQRGHPKRKRLYTGASHSCPHVGHSHHRYEWACGVTSPGVSGFLVGCQVAAASGNTASSVLPPCRREHGQFPFARTPTGACHSWPHSWHSHHRTFGDDGATSAGESSFFVGCQDAATAGNRSARVFPPWSTARGQLRPSAAVADANLPLPPTVVAEPPSFSAS